jgi:hypothetical protein
VEANSESGGKIFRVGRNNFQGKEEVFSWSGGMIFILRGKQIQGGVEEKSGQQMVRWKHFRGENSSCIWGWEKKGGTKYGASCIGATEKHRFLTPKVERFSGQRWKQIQTQVEADSGSGGKIFM